MRNTEREHERLRMIMETSKTLGVVGMSRNIGKAAHNVPRFLMAQGYRVIPINPNAKTVANERAYPSLRDLEDVVDTVVIFRPSEDVMEIVRQAIQRRHEKGDIQTIWMQEGIRDEGAARLAEENGITVVQDRCMAKEYRRLFRQQDD